MFCRSLVSFVCCVAMVDVLKRMRSRRLSGLVSGWEDMVSVIMEFTFVMKDGS